MLRVSDHFERSDTGRARRENEDSFYARSPMFAVADGMGGAQAGEVASQLAVEVLQQGLPERGGSVEQRLRELVVEANARINALSRTDEQRAGMGTTMTLVYVGEHEISVAHVGDSRLYRLRDGRFERLTDDHTLVEELVRQGKLTPQEADHHPQRSIITRALGPEAAVEADSHTWPARDGDVYLICSDGLTSMISEAQVGELLTSARSLPEAGRALIDAANAAGGRDNITVILFRLEEVGTVGGGPPAQDTTEHDAVTVPGDAAPASEAATAAGAATAAATGPATAVAARGPATAPAEPAARRRDPRPPRTEGTNGRHRRRRRRRLRVPTGLLVSLFLLVAIALSAWYASQTVYFVGSNQGFVTVYRGLPYELPAGLNLYSVNYVSGVPVSELTAARRRLVTEHKLRSRDDAQDLVRQMESGALSGS
ncbi:MAG: family protein phosphatase [Solirubrobacteraceae bacterium]|jgi:protein phosphatase|nr:family protein phosphatase [Solirubrobacteraceae bacterium]